MKVKKLIEYLKRANPEAEISIRYPNFEDDYNEYADIMRIDILNPKEVEIRIEGCWDEI